LPRLVSITVSQTTGPAVRDGVITTLTVTVALYAYVVDVSVNTVSQYTIGTGGELSAISPPTASTGAAPRSVAVDPTGRY